ncbi:MAG: hypothetical protein Q7S40_23920 [Opitutaceae bacterium]|nr:hypothetical protein [Opitutaceae bacterium]
MKRKSTLFWLAVALGCAVAGSVGAWVKYKQPNLLLVWKPFILTQHQFDYELEFVKRGLVGEIFRLAGVPRTAAAVSIFSWAVLSLLALAIVRFHRRFSSMPDFGILSGPAIWLWATLLCPGTFLQAGGDLGRLDPVQLLLEITLLLTAMAAGWRWSVVATVITLVGVATHELFLLAQLPFVLGVHLFLGWHQPARRKELWTRGVMIAGAAAIAAGVIAAYGRMDTMPAKDYMAFLQDHRGMPQPSEEGIAVLYNSLGANIHYAWQQLANKAPWRIPWVAVVMLAYLAIGLAAVRWEKRSMLLIAAGAIGPLLLLFLAYDYGRWFSFATINVLLAVSVCQQNNDVAVNWKPLRWTWGFALLGPFGVTIGFPWW